VSYFDGIELASSAYAAGGLQYDIGELIKSSPLYRNNKAKKLAALLCILRDKDLHLINSTRNETCLYYYFSENSSFKEFSDQLDAVSALASDNELQLLVRVALDLKAAIAPLDSMQ